MFLNAAETEDDEHNDFWGVSLGFINTEFFYGYRILNGATGNIVYVPSHNASNNVNAGRGHVCHCQFDPVEYEWRMDRSDGRVWLDVTDKGSFVTDVEVTLPNEWGALDPRGRLIQQPRADEEEHWSQSNGRNVYTSPTMQLLIDIDDDTGRKEYAFISFELSWNIHPNTQPTVNLQRGEAITNLR
ncbi:MAG: hypothetical protein IKW74_02430 [Thermoguttaceae bacterium]|nr:hypothetical protein [Thermoguttaceae bacterium]